MRRILTLVCLLVIGGKVWSQQEFVFIQSEANHPFYVRIGNSTYSSSAFGHIILAPLKDSSYHLFIGFARSEFPEQEFDIRLNRRDRGFELRHNGSEAWTLFELQTMQSIQSVVREKQDTSVLNEPKRSDPFANLMAGLVNDSTVLYTFARNETKSPPGSTVKEPSVALAQSKNVAAVTTIATGTHVSKKTPVGNDSSSSAQNATDTATNDTLARSESKPDTTKTDSSTLAAITENKPDLAKSNAQAAVIAPTITKIAEQPVEEGLQLKFLVRDSLINDTIDIMIPSDKMMALDKLDSTAEKQGIVSVPTTDTQAVAKEHQSADTASTPKKTLVLENSDCRNFASDQDVDKLRVQMMKGSTDDDRLNAARKMFKQKCYTARQVRALSELFPTDEGRYRFFDTAYPFVSDSANFKSLVEMLSDPDYIDRFNKLIRGA
jgi:hypothetical protein